MIWLMDGGRTHELLHVWFDRPTDDARGSSSKNLIEPRQRQKLPSSRWIPSNLQRTAPRWTPVRADRETSGRCSRGISSDSRPQVIPAGDRITDGRLAIKVDTRARGFPRRCPPAEEAASSQTRS